MNIVHTIADLRAALAASQRPAFVPTMGNLHDGHIALLKQAQTLGDTSVVSIFVNRLQFGPHEDFDRYPRTWDADVQRLQQAGCQLLFAPTEQTLYPQAQTYQVQPAPALAEILEGHFRPGFFAGVCTVVLKLFSCVFAGKNQGVAVFGQKDYQQLRVIEHMVQQFALPITVASGPTQRAPDGLALSSRNSYLTASQRQQAVQLAQALQTLGQRAKTTPHSDWSALETQAMQNLAAQGWVPDYLTVRRRSDLQTPQLDAAEPQDWVVLGAARLGATRLLDNLEI